MMITKGKTRRMVRVIAENKSSIGDDDDTNLDEQPTRAI